MPTVPIVPSTPQTVPAAVIASNVTEAVLIAAYAEWNGASASGDFLPCLEIYSDAGIRMTRVFPSTTVKAGDSAVVSYAPFPGGIGQASSGTDTDLYWPAADASNASIDNSTWANNVSGVGN